MTKVLEPRAVEPDAWRRWLKQGFGLYKRHPVLNSVLVAVCVAVFSVVFVIVPELAFFVLTLLVPLQIMVLFMRNARHSDKSEKLAAMLRPLGLADYKKLTLLAALFTILFSLLTMALLFLLNALAASGASAPNTAEKVFDVLFIGDEYRFVFVYGVIFFSELLTVIILFLHLFELWFAPALMYFEKLGLRHSVALSRHATRLNRAAVGKLELSLASLVLLNAFVSLGLFALILLPLIGATLYVAYRDVFLGIKENAAEQVRAAQPEFIPGLSH